jgi:hypothetical protein
MVDKITERVTDPKKAFPLREEVKAAKAQASQAQVYVEEYFLSQVTKYPALADHRQTIMESTSLMEAIKKVEILTEKENQVETPIVNRGSFKESQKGGWLGDRI